MCCSAQLSGYSQLETDHSHALTPRMAWRILSCLIASHKDLATRSFRNKVKHNHEITIMRRAILVRRICVAMESWPFFSLFLPLLFFFPVCYAHTPTNVTQRLRGHGSFCSFSFSFFRSSPCRLANNYRGEKDGVNQRPQTTTAFMRSWVCNVFRRMHFDSCFVDGRLERNALH